MLPPTVEADMLTDHVVGTGGAAGIEPRVQGPDNHHHCPQAVYNLGLRLHSGHSVRVRTGAGNPSGTQPNSRRGICQPPDVAAGRLCPRQMNGPMI